MLTFRAEVTAATDRRFSTGRWVALALAPAWELRALVCHMPLLTAPAVAWAVAALCMFATFNAVARADREARLLGIDPYRLELRDPAAVLPALGLLLPLIAVSAAATLAALVGKLRAAR